MKTRRGVYAVVALAFAVLIALSPAQNALASAGKVIPLQSELMVGSYVNLTLSSTVTPATGQTPSNYTGYVNETVTFVNSTMYKISVVTGDSINNGTFSFNTTSNFSLVSTDFPYSNNSNIYSLGPNSTVRGTFTFSNGTYDYNGLTVPMEKAKITDWIQYNVTYPVTTIEFDSYSGVLLNFTYESVINNSFGSPRVLYQNGSSILSATNLTMVPPAHSSTGGDLLPAVIVAVAAVLFVGGIVALRMRRRIK